MMGICRPFMRRDAHCNCRPPVGSWVEDGRSSSVRLCRRIIVREMLSGIVFLALVPPLNLFYFRFCYQRYCRLWVGAVRGQACLFIC